MELCWCISLIFVLFWVFWTKFLHFFSSADDLCQETKHAVGVFSVMLLVFIVLMVMALKKREWANVAKYYMRVLVLVGWPIFEIYIFWSNPNPFSEKCESSVINSYFKIVQFICVRSCFVTLTISLCLLYIVRPRAQRLREAEYAAQRQREVE